MQTILYNNTRTYLQTILYNNTRTYLQTILYNNTRTYLQTILYNNTRTYLQTNATLTPQKKLHLSSFRSLFQHVITDLDSLYLYPKFPRPNHSYDLQF